MQYRRTESEAVILQPRCPVYANADEGASIYKEVVKIYASGGALPPLVLEENMQKTLARLLIGNSIKDDIGKLKAACFAMVGSGNKEIDRLVWPYSGKVHGQLTLQQKGRIFASDIHVDLISDSDGPESTVKSVEVHINSMTS